MKVYINRRPIDGPWGGGAHFVNAVHRYAVLHDVKVLTDLHDKPDVLFIFHPDPEHGTMSFEDALRYRENIDPKVKIVIRVNECDARKGTVGVDDQWIRMGSNADHSFFVSKWMKNYFSDRWSGSNSILINGADHTRFKNRRPGQKHSAADGKKHIVCAHWSSHPLKGQETYEWLDSFVGANPNITFTYIGRTEAKLPNSRVVAPMVPLLLAGALTTYDVCVNGTQFDPGPNAVIESISAGLPTFVHANGGGAVEFAGSDHVYNYFEDLERILLSNECLMDNTTKFEHWNDVMEKFFKELRMVMKKK